MEITITSVISRTTFVARDNSLVMSGTYEMNGDGQLTELSGTVHTDQQGIAGEVRVSRSQSGLRYNYSDVADEDFDTIRAIVLAVVANAENNEEEGGES